MIHFFFKAQSSTCQFLTSIKIASVFFPSLFGRLGLVFKGSCGGMPRVQKKRSPLLKSRSLSSSSVKPGLSIGFQAEGEGDRGRERELCV